MGIKGDHYYTAYYPPELWNDPRARWMAMAVVAARCVEFNSRLALNLKALEHECYIEPGRMDEESGSTFVIPPDEIQYWGIGY